MSLPRFFVHRQPLPPQHTSSFHPENAPHQMQSLPSNELPHPPPPHPPPPLQAITQSPKESPMQTPYMLMCMQADQGRMRYTICAAVFTWLILAGYLVVPNTFTSLQSSKALSGSKGGQIIQSTIQNVQLLPFAGALCLIGTIGIFWLWSRWRTNYLWLTRNIFMYVCAVQNKL